MLFADKVYDRRSWCQRQMLRLRLIALGQDGLTLSRRASTEVRDTTNAVIAEVEAMSRAVLEAGRQDPGAETFLWVRVNRLAAAGDQAVNAARSGDIAALRAHLLHFDTLTSAIWTVQLAVYGQERALGRPLPESERGENGEPGHGSAQAPGRTRSAREPFPLIAPLLAPR